MDFPTRIDWWLMTVVGSLVTICLASGIFLPAVGGDTFLAVLAVGSAVLVLGLMVPIRYRLAEGVIRIRAGLFLWKIPLAAVRRIRPSLNPLFAPAWSLRRLHIEYTKPGGKRAFVLISPKERERFLRTCADTDPGLQASADGLVRRSDPETTTGETP